jgi:GTP-binding protein Era
MNAPARPHRSGFVAVVGRPSTGKSSLLNTALGQLVAPVSPRPQTTRRRQLGILTRPHAQIIFVDTPGMHVPHDRLGERMNAIARESLADAEAVLVVFDLSAAPGPEDERAAERVRTLTTRPVLMALNKADLVRPADLAERVAAYGRLLPQAAAWVVSATRGDACTDLFDHLEALLPEGPQYFPPDELTQTYERDLASELIRAAAMSLLHGEMPHSVAALVESYNERSDRHTSVRAVLYVERESQKAIVIGRGGSMVREIGTLARRRIEEMSGREVYLDLRVKVLKGWRQNEDALRHLGYLPNAR